ncbi:Dirigent protein 17 [Capsicum baccatum]|uniref:Dirigent protein 17 n=1 Tax=Capsicum baccatum TaxID=33114 RepID=A0A2G2VUY6_CAPBA|nr:Dirigent protein 17 [Capsicum baccatum]
MSLRKRSLQVVWGQYCCGKVTGFDEEVGWFKVKYVYDDVEDFEWNELEQVLRLLDFTIPLKTIATKIIKSRDPFRNPGVELEIMALERGWRRKKDAPQRPCAVETSENATGKGLPRPCTANPEFHTITELTVSDSLDILKNYLSSFTETGTETMGGLDCGYRENMTLL